MKKSFLSYSISLILAFGVKSVIAIESTNTTQTNIAQVAQSLGFEKLAVQINKSPVDKANYQAIRLANGMEVLLISDSDANKSLFSIGLPIGSMEDPESQQGLAHYLEHMILMGSKNYPETNSLDGFLSKNGGRNNAYTAPDSTIYYLQVNHNAFDEAVERLSDAIAQPLLSENNAKKEINAVNAEMVRAKYNDGYRIRSVNLATANPAHPMTKFAIGNKDTLSDKENSKLQDELIAFYNKYYSANLMKAVLYSNQSIDKLAQLAADNLGKVENKNLTTVTIKEQLYRDEEQGVILHYKPISPQKSITLSFDMPEDKSAFRQKSGEYLSYLFSNNTEGTLADYLVKNGLSNNGISAYYSDDISRNRGSFDIYVRLTDKGLNEQDKIISLLFQQIELVKQQGIQSIYFDELKESLKQDFQHLRPAKTFNYAARLVEQMLSYPLANIFDQPYVAEEMNSDEIREKLNLMTLDKARILIVDQKAETDCQTLHFQAPYSITKISEEQQTKWLDFSQNPTLKLPTLNPYFTTEFKLNDVDKSRDVPKLVLKEQGREIYAMPSRYFSDESKARVHITLGISPKKDELKAEIAAELLNIMNGLAHKRTSFQASVARLDTSFIVGANGISISAEGYTQNLAKLLQDMLLNFSRFELNENTLEQAKQRYSESLDALEKTSAQQQATQKREDFANYPYFEADHKRQMLEEIRLSDVENHRTRVLNAITGIRMLSVGNLSDNQLKDLLQSIEQVVKNSNSQIDFGRYVDINQSQRKINVVRQISNENNALSISYFPNGYDELESRVRATLLSIITSRWYFDDIRTDKQLGYTVLAHLDRIGKTSGLTFNVQSPTASIQTIMEHNQRFFNESFERLKSLSESDFEKYRSSTIKILQRTPDSLSREFNGYTPDFERGNSDFNHRAQMINRLQTITLEEIIDFYHRALIEQKAFIFASQVIGSNPEINQVADFSGFEKIEQIEKLQQEFEIGDF